MKKEQIIQALYEANTVDAIEKAGDEWSAFYQNASPEDKEYLANGIRKFSEYVLEKSKLSSLEMQAVLAEYEAMKLTESQHS
ncbi:hypothetical protein SAMN05216327_103227 [Dyadobacter sp. SG02]|uniref:hypothetical protein n=1 Tax=Dyadobacter sp. SG02 TaxID=1855291 RepID=UPI0008BFAA56|nr:hypothetical protein [Dyadobacter sp. SG02]SEI68277.1 hypothetical protein SAMN05216327_103227 [Dyadobacter sp. SG02]